MTLAGQIVDTRRRASKGATLRVLADEEGHKPGPVVTRKATPEELTQYAGRRGKAK